MLIAAGARLSDNVGGGDAVQDVLGRAGVPGGSEAMSKTRLFRSIKSLDREAVATLLEDHPELKHVKDERGRNALHFLCGLPGADKGRERSLELAQYLLGTGFDINAAAFVEGPFKATPLWYAISRGRNLPLAKLLLKKGSTPEYCLWSAGFHDDVEAIDLLIKHGARVDPVAEDETPFLSAIKWSHFAAAERLLRHGADVNFQNSKGKTALHFLLKKNSDRKHVEMLLRHGADPTLENAEGIRPLDMVAKRRDKSLFELFSTRASSKRTRAKAN
jgi:ankyrin repeat protein